MIMEEIFKFIDTPAGSLLLELCSTLFCSIMLCVAVELFDFKRLKPFLTYKRILSIFIVLFEFGVFRGS